MRQSTFPRSGILVLGEDSVQSLVPSTLISQVESLLDGHRLAEAAELADQQRKKLQGTISIDEDQTEELNYVYQRLGFQYLTETLFEDAGQHLFNGNLDPRLLVSYYPELGGTLFNVGDAAEVFAGVAECMPKERSIDDIIRNYSPHISPDTRSAPPTAELRKILNMAADDMLEKFLRKCRTRRIVAGGPKAKAKSDPVDAVVDTVLAKLLARQEKTAELYALLREPNDIVLSELEQVLKDAGQYNALCTMYKQRGEDLKLLDVWSKLAEGEWTDDEIPDPISDIITLLVDKRDRALLQKWGIWLTKRDPERGMKLLTRETGNKRRERPEEDLQVLNQLRDANATAAAQFLEHLVLQKRSTSRELHTQLATLCVEQLLSELEAESVSKLWRAKASSYASSRNETSFLSYFASTTPASEHKRVRLKTILFLQGSSLYDPLSLRERIQTRKGILKLELAILDGKLGNHRAALATLVHDLRDATSAEAYCTLGGDAVPGKTAVTIGEQYGLQTWSTALFLPPPTKSGAVGERILKVVDEGLKKSLLKILLEVYMNDKESSAEHAARLLNAQAVNLDVLDVISLVPAQWPVSSMSTFLTRSLRRTMHMAHEGQIIKSISTAQNLEVVERTWLILREQGAIVEEAVDDDDEHTNGEGEGTGVPASFEEKGGILLAENITTESRPPNWMPPALDDEILR